MNNWDSAVTDFLTENNYSAVIKHYEEIIENNPDEVTNYWYLGLAYLLNEQEAEAQTTWFIPFSEADETEEELYTQQLTKILFDEGRALQSKDNNALAWGICQTLKDINPSSIHNQLLIVELSITLKIFELEFITESDILEVLSGDNPPEIDLDFLLEVLGEVLRVANKTSIDFARSCLIYTKADQKTLEKIKYCSQFMAMENLYHNYSIDLLKMALEYAPKYVEFYHALFHLYTPVNKYPEAIDIAQRLKAQSSELQDTILANSLLFTGYMMSGQWSKIVNIREQQGQIWQDFINDTPDLKNSTFKQAFLSYLMPSLYLEDSLNNYRTVCNNIAKIFYDFHKPPEENVFSYAQTKEIRPLKIGYIGHTFRRHSVGFLGRWLLHHSDPEKVENYVYLVQGHQDDVTKRWYQSSKIKEFYFGDRDINRIGHKINQDQIDILVDVDSITGNITDLILCRKPAPVQVTWLGLDASGLPSIDYFIADPYVLPDHAQKYYQEKIWRLPHTYLAVDGFEVGTPTLTREDLDIEQDAVVFMNLQNPAKLNPDILKCQLKIIEATPKGYLFTKIRKDERVLKDLVTEVAKENNISLDKLRFLKSDASVETHRANMGIADVVLDTFPYNGSTTTLEALWREIPVVTRVGESFAARNSYTYLVNAGITEGIAWSEEEYIHWGIRMGADEGLRRDISWKLKQSKRTSPLWNTRQFAQEMEGAYQQMWQIYLETSGT
ncbi:MAG: O-linked N-acetylglucosamine transferase, SPINDLY family protein [Cyanobacterium sp. T60_A2020_053]|nr:O-linked N-acetylglucosamine transferase, SPINDLY family protein [Cyanobacterium sp. T60_A2020_053]